MLQNSKHFNIELRKQLWNRTGSISPFFIEAIHPLDGPNRRFSERGQLSQAIPQFHVERILHQWTPTARFESQRNNERRAYEDQILHFGVKYELQRTLAIRIATITLASDSAITLARFRPSKIHPKFFPQKFFP